MNNALDCNAINSLADSVRDVYDMKIPTESMESIILKLNGTLETSDTMSEFADGNIEKLKQENPSENQAEFRITVPEKQDPVNQRLNIARQIGHLFLHMGYVIDEKRWGRTEETALRKYAGTMEYEANEFAISFLLPQFKFLNELRETYGEGNDKDGPYNIEKLAKYFKVPKKLVINRAIQLGYMAPIK